MVARGNVWENCQLYTYFTENVLATFSNVLKCASGNVLKIVANKNDVKFPLKHRNMYGNPWLPVITGGNAFY